MTHWVKWLILVLLLALFGIFANVTLEISVRMFLFRLAVSGKGGTFDFILENPMYCIAHVAVSLVLVTLLGMLPMIFARFSMSSFGKNINPIENHKQFR